MSLLMVLADGILSNGAIHHCVAALAPDLLCPTLNGLSNLQTQVGKRPEYAMWPRHSDRPQPALSPNPRNQCIVRVTSPPSRAAAGLLRAGGRRAQIGYLRTGRGPGRSC